jgi:phytoene synthase
VLKRHGIARRHLFELLEGFELDAMEAGFRTVEDTLHYCYHVAGVVGVMMASIMGVRDQQVMQRAADLGIAFQLTNIARDVVEDMRVGRCYLPGDWMDRKGIARDAMHEPGHLPALHGLACELVDLAEDYYASARIGITRLPPRCAWAISSALLIYRDIGLRLRTGGLAAWQGRTRISGRRKTWRLCHGAWMAAHAVSMGRARAELPRSGLWTKAET